MCGGQAHEPGAGVVVGAGGQASRRRPAPSPPEASRRAVASRSSQLAAGTGGPGSLKSVASPLLESTTATDRLVGPSTAMSSWASPPASQVGRDGAGRRAADEPEDHGVVAQRVEDPGDVDPLAAGPFLDPPHAVARPGSELVDPVGDVEGDVGRDGEDHGPPVDPALAERLPGQEGGAEEAGLVPQGGGQQPRLPDHAEVATQGLADRLEEQARRIGPALRRGGSPAARARRRSRRAPAPAPPVASAQTRRAAGSPATIRSATSLAPAPVARRRPRSGGRWRRRRRPPRRIHAPRRCTVPRGPRRRDRSRPRSRRR